MGIAKVLRLDGWKNLLSGLGVYGKDKRVSMQYEYFKLSEVEVETLYASSDTAAKLVDELPEDALREWIEFNNMDSEIKDALMKKMDTIGARQRLEEGWKWGLMYGGAGIYMNVNDGRDPQDPVDETNILDVTSLTVLSRWELIPYQINSNLESPYFGQPAIYRLQTSQPTDFVQRYIHHSRILRFDGPMLPRRLRIQNQWWGESIFVRALNSIKNYETTNDSAVSALADYSVGVFKIKGLADLLASGQESVVKSRLEIANYSKSVIRSLLIDAEGESYENVSRNLTGVKDIVDMSANRLVTTSKMPHSKFLGEGPKSGLGGNGSGDSEKLDWYDHVKNQQKIVLRPRVDTLARYMMLAKNGPTKGQMPAGWTFEFCPLWQMSDKDKADVRLKTSQADASDITNQILTPDEVALSRYGGQKYSMDTVINKSLRKLSAPPMGVQTSTTPTDPNAPVKPPTEQEVEEHLMEPGTSTYPNPEPSSGGKVQSPSPGFVSRKDAKIRRRKKKDDSDDIEEDGGPGSGPQGGSKDVDHHLNKLKEAHERESSAKENLLKAQKEPEYWKSETYSKAAKEHKAAVRNRQTVTRNAKNFVASQKHDDTDGIVQDGKPLHAMIFSKHHYKTEEDARKLYHEMGGFEGEVAESTDAWKFSHRPEEDFQTYKGFSHPHKPGLKMVFGNLKDGARESTINEPLFEQANKNWQALWSWNETPECGPNGKACTELQG